jgi:hypothetical protein
MSRPFWRQAYREDLEIPAIWRQEGWPWRRFRRRWPPTAIKDRTQEKAEGMGIHPGGMERGSDLECGDLSPLWKDVQQDTVQLLWNIDAARSSHVSEPRTSRPRCIAKLRSKNRIHSHSDTRSREVASDQWS